MDTCLPRDSGIRAFSTTIGKQKLSLPLNIFRCESEKDLTARVFKFQRIPFYKQDEFVNDLKSYVRDEQLNSSSNLLNAGLKFLAEDLNRIDVIAENVSQKYEDKWSKDSDYTQTSLDFSKSFHFLIHSPAMEILLILQNKYQSVISGMLSTKETSLSSMTEQHKLEIDRVQENVGFVYTKQDVENLVLKQEADLNCFTTSWDDIYQNVTEKQKQEFCRVVIELCHEMKNNDNQLLKSGNAYNKVYDILKDESPKYKQPFGIVTSPMVKENKKEIKKYASILMEESFTINLGAQLKTMHNVRLMVSDVLNLCCCSNENESEALRFQTAMTLYSNTLSAVVLLKNISYQGENEKKFAEICASSTECHFMPLKQQFLNVTSPSQQLCEGDFYVTTHSNLSGVQIAFHLVVDEKNLQSTTISSRHPVVSSLKHILKVSSSYDINTITLPLLLTNVLTEDITFQWCVKRAELVMKCVKGYMMEMAAWDGGSSRNIQFVIPPGCSEEVFDRLRYNLPEIFRTTSARNLTPAHKKNLKP